MIFSGYCAIHDIAANPRILAKPMLPIACIYSHRATPQKNGDNILCFDYVSVVLLNIFSIKMLFSGYRAIRDIAARRCILSTPLLPLTCVPFNRAATPKYW
jgi:hypothetical protein